MRFIENTKLLLRLWWRPAAAMSGILDQGSLLYASLAVLAVSLPAAWTFRFYTPLLVLALIYVPGTLLVTNLVARLGTLGTVFTRDYSPLLTCSAMAWAAAYLPAVVAAWLFPDPFFYATVAAGLVYFAVLMFFAIRTVFGTGNGVALAAVCLSAVPLVVAGVFWGPIRFILGWLASPFFLFYAFYYLRGEFGNLGAGLRRQQTFRRMLETAAINPHDAEAQYQLGLIYQQRRQYTAAVEHFRKAVAIDPQETDAHFQLGRIAREQGRLQDALEHFQIVLDQDDKHSLSEILREIGAVYLTAQRYEDARHELEVYIERRPYDPEGLYYYGQTLEHSGRADEARACYARAMEAARTAPRYLRRATAKWSRLAQKQLRKLG